MTIRVVMGNTGPTVRKIQNALNAQGYSVGTPDGKFGEKTHNAVLAFQTDNGLVADGLVGRRTYDLLMKGKDTPSWALKESDLFNAAVRLGVELTAIKAVSEVESAGDGFLSEGKPKILYERHIMRRVCMQDGLHLLVDLVEGQRPDLINKQRGGYRGGAHEWTRLKLAKQLNYDNALQACSWGRYQIMGFHWKSLGYASIKEFRDVMCRDEAGQLDAFVRFIEADKDLHQALKTKDWVTFARIYNGPAYAEHQYDVRLAAAYARHQG